MEYSWLKEYCLSKPGAVHDYKEEWLAHRYLVGGKMFLMDGGDKNETPIITLKLEPLHGELLRSEHTCVIPGHYMNKTHWNSVYKSGDVPDDKLKALIDESYKLIFESLPKKLQAQILEGQA